MIPNNKKSPAASRKPQPFNRQPISAAPIRDVPARLKTAGSAPSVKRPVAPPAFRPQPAPKVLQRKKQVSQRRPPASSARTHSNTLQRSKASANAPVSDEEFFAQFAAPTPEELMASWVNNLGPMRHKRQVGGKRRTQHGWDVTMKWVGAINYNCQLRTVRMNFHIFDDGQRALGSMWMDGVHGHSIQVAHEMMVNRRQYLEAMASHLYLDAIPQGDARF